jgi:UDP-glucose 4-epimerase
MINHKLMLPKAPTRVVLLGGTGFIGKAIEARLREAQLEVLSLGTAHLDLAADTAYSALSRILRPTDAIVMLAAITPDKDKSTFALTNNLAMMDSICRYLQEKKCAQFIYLSSDAVYGLTDEIIKENTRTNPKDDYGAMHRTRELMASRLNVPLLVLRPTLVYGHDDPHFAYGPSRFFQTGKTDGAIWLFGHGSELRDYIYIYDFTEILLRSLLYKTVGLLNVVSGNSISFLSLAQLIVTYIGRPVRVCHKPQRERVHHRCYDNNCLTTGFNNFSLTPLEEGLLCYSK